MFFLSKKVLEMYIYRLYLPQNINPIPHKNMRILFALCLVALSISCTKEQGADINKNVDIDALESLTDYTVPVKKGCTSVVTLDDEVLAVTREPITIAVPKSATRSNQFKITYSTEDIFGDYGSSRYWQYIAFEDTRNGDYDYNDVVIHCRVKTDIPWNYDGSQLCKHAIAVQPVALGGTQTLKLGMLYRDNNDEIQEQILCEDIRRDLFKGDPTFPINTDPTKPTRKVTNYMTELFECKTRESDFRVVWFLDSGKDRLYAATTNFGMNKTVNMVSKDGLPYGISMTQKWCYPIEWCNIRKAYPNFDQWLRTGNQDVLIQNTVRENTFPATVRNGEDGDLWDWKKQE